MAELKSKKSFGQAFREAEKQGLKKFQWNGGWYTTEKAENKKAQTRTTTAKGDYKEKTNKSDGTRSNRYTVKNDKNGYYVFDNEVQRVIGSPFKDKQAVVNYMKSDDFKNDAGETVATAARTKLNRKTSGFQPVDENKNYNDKQGDTRLYQERGTGRYLVTDNYGNIVGYSFDPAAATSDANWGGWIAYTGSKDDIKAAESGKMRDLANRNEDAQKTKQAKDRVTDEWERQMGGIRRLQGGFNTVQGMLNMPNNVITGAIRAGVSDDYSWDDYKDSFTIDGLWRGNASVGLGDVFEFNNPYARFAANLINPMSVVGTTMKSSAPTYKVAVQETKPLRFKAPVESSKSSSFRRGSRPNEGMGTNQRGQTQYGGKHTASSSGGQLQDVKANNFKVVLEKTPGEFNMTPFNAAFRYDPKTSYNWEESIPVANFWYSGEGNPNTYAQGRIATGEVVPGTSGENWSGGQSGGTVVVDNTKGHVSPSFGGVTVGGGRDNQSSWYLPLAYKKGGKSKLISRTSCRK